MLRLNFIQENRDTVIRKLAIKNFDATEIVDKIIALDNERRDIQKQADDQQAEMNRAAKQIGMLMKEGRRQEAEEAKANTSRLKESIATLNARHADTVNALNALIVRLPNLPNDIVPPGKSDADNVIVKISDNIPAHEPDQLPHWDLAKKYNLIDFDPFKTVDPAGVGRLIELSVREGKAANPELVCGICGETGGDPESIGHFYEYGCDYVSCSPFRVPGARLAAAQAVAKANMAKAAAEAKVAKKTKKASKKASKKTDKKSK